MKKEFEVLKYALAEAGKTACRYLGKTKYELKGKANLVTQADLACQKKIISIISNALPEHGFLAEEEQKNLKTTGRFLWVIDPIDGTTNYAHTFAHSSVSIALTDNGAPVLGGVLDFFKGEEFTAVKGKGAKLNGKKIKVSDTARLDDSLLITGFPYDRSTIKTVQLPIFEKFIYRCHDIRRTGSAALDLCWVAAGRADGYYEFGVNPWDVCAGTLILEEAGGKVTGFDGKKWKALKDYGRQTLASNGKIHKEMLSVLKTAGDKK